MKHLLSVLCLAGLASACTSSPATLAHEAVSSYLKKTLDDPASYQPVRWGKEKAWRQQDADTVLAHQQALILAADYAHSRSFIDSCTAGTMLAGADTVRQGHDKRSAVAAGKRLDSKLPAYKKLLASTDSSRLGVVYGHAFRAKNKAGALVLDSARFVVTSAGVVSVLP